MFQKFVLIIFLFHWRVHYQKQQKWHVPQQRLRSACKPTQADQFPCQTEKGLTESTYAVRRVLWPLIWVCTVCPHVGTLGIQGFNLTPTINDDWGHRSLHCLSSNSFHDLFARRSNYPENKNSYNYHTTGCILNIWAATWQNQQSDCAPSETSDQSLRCPHEEAWVLSYQLSA